MVVENGLCESAQKPMYPCKKITEKPMMQLSRDSKKIEIEGGADEFQIFVHKIDYTAFFF
jgi:hypothetical protein